MFAESFKGRLGCRVDFTGFYGGVYMVLPRGFVWNISGLGLGSLISHMCQSIWDSKRNLESFAGLLISAVGMASLPDISQTIRVSVMSLGL